ncbi:MAG TPA: flagellar hook capping protein [Alphaproteobacteria bacterium]|jgi:flagellar basal-body rod modification protein FlgD|nr:flagellar hook capping protein [Alphaproteobacteria bacterium]HAM48074.1 flagellar hook capping protein [Alphaproteobacteria bacterium]HBA43353.1 flagellar hook capping protein [Alphaproteobacteria bacterium]HBC53214.1 flagellar hook capping protein [Alphaproteobacteria bacterium]HCO90124.1 flagellar hook capping protein [Alphaproteobacteria bacterium]
MEITPSTPSLANSAATGAAKTLAQDFDTFLTLLTSQLQNQDPLEPMDSSEFTNQLVQFSSVEQAIQTNKNFETLIALTSANTTSAALDYLGRQVTYAGAESNLQGAGIDWSYDLDPDAVASSIAVKDATGKVVFAADGPEDGGTHQFAWNGKDNAGTDLPDGVYSLSVSAIDKAQNPVSADIFSTGTVTGVDVTATNPVLSIGGITQPLVSIREINQDS